MSLKSECEKVRGKQNCGIHREAFDPKHSQNLPLQLNRQKNKGRQKHQICVERRGVMFLRLLHETNINAMFPSSFMHLFSTFKV